MTDIIARAEQIARKKIQRIVKERMLWPNPNPSERLELAWDAYEEAYARFFYNLPSLTGLDVVREFLDAWEDLCNAVMSENCDEQS